MKVEGTGTSRVPTQFQRCNIMEEVVKDTEIKGSARYTIGLTRIALGWVFLFAFLDKLFGLGHTTDPSRSILAGGKATAYYLGPMQTGKPFAWLFQPMAGKLITEILFLGGLFLIGTALILGIATRIAGYSGAALMILMYMSSLPIAHNWFMDEHLIYAGLMVFMAQINAGQYLGIGKFWNNLKFVQKTPILA